VGILIFEKPRANEYENAKKLGLLENRSLQKTTKAFKALVISNVFTATVSSGIREFTNAS